MGKKVAWYIYLAAEVSLGGRDSEENSYPNIVELAVYHPASGRHFASLVNPQVCVACDGCRIAFAFPATLSLNAIVLI